MKKAETIATWRVSLDCTCPKCGWAIDVMDDESFRENRIEACEHDTPRTDNMEVSCSACGHEFEVCCEY